jgi:hypothetical protein
MRPIPKKLLNEILADPYYKTCIRAKTNQCDGRITLEHAIIYAGRQVNEKWAILPVCEKHHGVNSYQDRGDLDKRFHEWVALTILFSSPEEYQDQQRKLYSRAWNEWQRKLIHLNKIYEGKRCPASVQE